MSARREDAYEYSNKQTSRYHTILSNSKYNSSSILNKTDLKKQGSLV